MIMWRIAAWSVAVFAALFVCGYFAFAYYGNKVLSDHEDALQMAQTTIVYDAEGKEAFRLFAENREYVSLENIPDLLVQAFIAIEDRRFERHPGIDILATVRAFLVDLRQGSYVQGGSTITQQLAKLTFLTPDKTWKRKLAEWAVAAALERRYSKDEIMETYLNRIYFGNGVYGVKAAAQYYFGKTDLKQLELWEMATLAAIPKAPGLYNPKDEPERSSERRKLVLDAMVEIGAISAEEARYANEQTYQFPEHKPQHLYGQYADYVIWEAMQLTGLDDGEIYRGGYRIYTALDPETQQRVEEAFQDEDTFPPDGPREQVEGAMVIIDNETGAIVAIAGGRDGVRRGLNRALVPRQPGSVFKPVAVYAPALETGEWHPYSSLPDEPIDFGGYRPRNADGKYSGKVWMRDALRLSKNVPAVWLLDRIGIDESFEFLSRAGFTLPDEDRHLALALGGLTYGATPLEIATIYAAFARGGEWVKPYAIRKIVDGNGHTVYEHRPVSKPLVSERTAYYLTKMLEDAVQSGTGQAARIEGMAVAGKTGSTQTGLPGVDKGFRDIWFAGYTPDRTAVVWMGFDRTDKEHYIQTDSLYPARLFKRIMSAHRSRMDLSAFPRPEQVPELYPPPAPPEQVSAKYDRSRRGVIIRWERQSDHYVYRVYRREEGEAEFSLLQTAYSGEVRDFTVERGKTYEYALTAYEPGLGMESEKSKIFRVEVPGRSPFRFWRFRDNLEFKIVPEGENF
jgi:penicillin-binding protein 2A